MSIWRRPRTGQLGELIFRVSLAVSLQPFAQGVFLGSNWAVLKLRSNCSIAHALDFSLPIYDSQSGVRMEEIGFFKYPLCEFSFVGLAGPKKAKTN